MGAGDQIDVVGSLFLKAQENDRKLFISYLFAESLMADGKILAETAA